MPARVVLLVAALALAACSGGIPLFDAAPAAPPEGRYVALRYIGSGGWLLRRGPDAIATAPFVSNPTWFELLLPAKPDEARIEAAVPAMPDVEIVLVGHAHYDHAMDLPSIARTKAPAARFYGGKTAINVLAAWIDRGRLRAFEDGEVAAGERTGAWFYNGARTIRFMPLRSTHAPHMMGIKIEATGSVEQPQTASPGAPLAWKEGETLAFVIDFLDPGEGVDFRVYYQDAASRAGTGVMPVLGGRDAAAVDAAILCVAAFDQVADNPEHILASVRPRHVIGGHWEDFFFRKYDAPLRPAFGTSLPEFQRRMRAAFSGPVYLPRPGDTIYLPIPPRP